MLVNSKMIQDQRNSSRAERACGFIYSVADKNAELRRTLTEGAIYRVLLRMGCSRDSSYHDSMSKLRTKTFVEPPDEVLFHAKGRKVVPHEFVLEALAEVSPRTNPMFGCLAVYVGEKIVLILRDRPKYPRDNGVWIATTMEHHESLRREFPNMRSVGLLGKKITGWQVLPADATDFEESALRACELIVAKDSRIGKVPKGRRRAR